MYKLIIKPFFDFIFSLIGIFFLFPIFILITILLAIANNGKPFFLQFRTGLKGKIFKIIKFKTMNDKKDSLGNFYPDQYRLTKIGKFVRKTSLDEIPQFINVLKGDMSIVGPRPLLPEYLPFYSDVQNRRHDVKSGITGWAQTNGRNAISWTTKFELDVFYVDNISFFLDLKILFLTLKKVINSKEIVADGHATMPRFDKLIN